GTLQRISRSQKFSADNMTKLGLGNVEGLSFLGETEQPLAASARLCEKSKGKDTTIGHWEIAGIVSPYPQPTYPDGFPVGLLYKLSELTGRGWLCGLPYSGTEVIKKHGEEHMQTGDLIVYTSADSVMQIAAHEEIVPVEQLYEYCRLARDMMQGKHGVGRIIARPFIGTCAEDFSRTTNRHDFSLEPPRETLLDAMSKKGLDVIGVGKIYDIFAGRGVTETIRTNGNENGMAVTMDMLSRDFNGLCFVNLVDFDMLYGHRQDVDGYAQAVAQFDAWLPEFIAGLRDDDVLMNTADHGCDPGDDSTDHTREYVSLLVYGKGIKPADLGTRASFADIAATIAEWFDVSLDTKGESFASLI
ncbi:MAG: phosphopentomutase, partial [Clostridia bacterium]|nr:phosphopentomutase [Clostridia bacterium]